MKYVAVVLLSLLSLGRCVPLTNCPPLLKRISISPEEMLGKWVFIGGSSQVPGSRYLTHLITNAWVELSATSQSNVLKLVQTQKIYGTCSSLAFNVSFDNSSMLIEQPFYLKETYLQTECPDCLVAHENIVSGNDAFRSLYMFSRSGSVSPAALEMFKKQAKCLWIPPPIIISTDNEMCPDDIQPLEGLSTINSLLEARMVHRVARFLDAIFDLFVN